MSTVAPPTSPFPAVIHNPVAAAGAPNEWAAQRPSVCIDRFVTLFSLQRDIMRTSAVWLIGVPYWDAKVAIGEHVMEDAEHAEAIINRLQELKAANTENKKPVGLDALMLDLASARSGDEWLHALYTVIKPWMREQVLDYLRVSDPVMDQPSHLVAKAMLRDLDGQIAWFRDYTPQYSAWEQPDTREWLEYVAAVLAAVRLHTEDIYPAAGRPVRPADTPDFEVFESVRRDACNELTDQLAYGNESESFLEERFLIFYNHTQEMQFAETLCATIYETDAMPWAFHYDLARHMADEVRHSQMGVERLEQLGVDFRTLKMQTQNFGARTNLDPVERFCLMTLVMEASSFERKRANVKLFEANDDPVSTVYEAYDVRDEMMHVNLGHVWVPVLQRVYNDKRSVHQVVEHCKAIFGI